MAYIVALAEALIHPALVATSHILITVLLICRMVVHVVVSAVLLTTRHDLTLSFISRTAIEFVGRFLFEIALFTELIVHVLFVWILDCKFPLILGLLYPGLGVYRREGNVFVLRIECE